MDRKDTRQKGRFTANSPDKIIVLAVRPSLMYKGKVTCAGTGPTLSQERGEQNLCFFSKAPFAAEASS